MTDKAVINGARDENPASMLADREAGKGINIAIDARNVAKVLEPAIRDSRAALPEKGKNDMFHKQCQQDASHSADDAVYDRHPCVEPPILRTVFEPLNLLAFILGCFLAHFIIGPLIFG